MEFRREFVLEDALRHAGKKKFDPEKTLKVLTAAKQIICRKANIYIYILLSFQVIFIGEEGEDLGGLRREFWRLFSSAAAEQYCTGSEQFKTFQQNVPALEVR